MHQKNYYSILGVPEGATADELRQAYRELAKKYHPDAAPDNPYAAAHFAAIGEAYGVLSNAASRAAYDEDRWLRGLSNRSKAAVRITPQWIKTESGRLRKHMEVIDTHRMNHASLRDYILLLLSDEHLSILQTEPETYEAITDNILVSITPLRQTYVPAVTERLLVLAGNNEALRNKIESWEHERAREAKWIRYRPFIVLTFTALLCILLWLLGRGH